MGRHPGVENLLSFFEFNHLREGKVRDTSRRFHDMAHELTAELPDSPELTVALRKLLESKDGAVRAAVEATMNAAQRAEGRD